MSLIAVRAMVRKDLQMFLSDRRAVIMSFVAPIAIASFFGSIFSGQTNDEPSKIPVAIVDEDRSTVSNAIVAGARADRILDVTTPSGDEAREAVRRGDIAVGVVIPAGFGSTSGLALFAGRNKPQLTMWYDPSRGAELGLVRGILTR
jgi:ABC-2 type transport system permease protein